MRRVRPHVWQSIETTRPNLLEPEGVGHNGKLLLTVACLRLPCFARVQLARSPRCCTSHVCLLSVSEDAVDNCHHSHCSPCRPLQSIQGAFKDVVGWEHISETNGSRYNLLATTGYSKYHHIMHRLERDPNTGSKHDLNHPTNLLATHCPLIKSQRSKRKK